jgi:hypothetical protein
MASPSHSHRRRHEYEVVRSARLLLIGIFVMLRIADIAMYYYSIHAPHPVPAVRGHAIINIMWTTVFLIALWMRRTWARYVLIVYMGYVAFVTCAVVSIGFLVEEIQMGPAIAIAAEFVAYFSGTMILIFSRDIGRLTKRI